MTSRIKWKIELETEIERVERDVERALAESDRAFSYIDRIRDRISSGEMGEQIVEICRPFREHNQDPGDSKSAYLTRLDQELSRAKG
jgi:hypothetical protein